MPAISALRTAAVLRALARLCRGANPGVWVALLAVSASAGLMAVAATGHVGRVGTAVADSAYSLGTDDYPLADAHPDSTDEWNFAARECTSFVAWRVSHDLGVSNFTNGYRDGWFGDAGNWAANARRIGLPVDSTPTYGSVAVFPPYVGGAGKYGHVAIVLSRNTASGKITVEDYNWRDAQDHENRFEYSQHAVAIAGLQFIHIGSPIPKPRPKPPVPVKQKPWPPAHSFRVDAPAGLNDRTAPRLNASLLRSPLHYGTTVAITCQVLGDRIPGGDPVWDRLTDGSYVSDYWIDTPAVGFSPGIPRC